VAVQARIAVGNARMVEQLRADQTLFRLAFDP